MIVWQQQTEQQKIALLRRPVSSVKNSLSEQVSSIINKVRANGDQALLDLAKQFDGVEMDTVRLPESLLQESLANLSVETKNAIDTAYQNITTFHRAQKSNDITIDTMPGVTCQLKTAPINAVGLYIPGGSAPLPSTVLMLGIPAQIAGCKRIVLFTPPNNSPDSKGSITSEILYAAKLCGVTEIYRSGGAQAIAAMAYGTQSIQKVDKIFGPGNSFVTEAKQQVSIDPSGAVIDMPAGPSEVLVIADGSANPSFIAADLLSQAEHGADSQVILVCDDKTTIEQTQQELNRQLASLSRREIAQKALENSCLILTESLAESIDISNRYAPEHLIVQTENSESLLSQLENAASIFLGPYTPESAGDYASGTNHVLPTYGYSKTISSLSLIDFTRRYTVQSLSADGMRTLGPAIMTLAEAEGLDAHRNAVAIRLAELGENN